MFSARNDLASNGQKCVSVVIICEGVKVNGWDPNFPQLAEPHFDESRLTGSPLSIEQQYCGTFHRTCNSRKLFSERLSVKYVLGA